MLESLKALSDRARPGEWHVDWLPAWNEDNGAEEAPICDGICIHTPEHEAESVLCCSEREAAFIVALVNAYRAGQLHDATAFAEARAEGRRQGLEEADDREVERILGLTEAQVIAEIEAEGRDPQALAEAMRGQMGATFKLCEEIKALREALASLIKHVEESRYRCGLSGLCLDGNIPQFARAEAALANPPETQKPETGESHA
jgi:hypothetical protein